MEDFEIIKYLKDNNISAYQVHLDTGISINTISDFLEQKRSPRSSTINKLAKYVKKHHQENEGFKEPENDYKKISTSETHNLLEFIGGALIKNQEVITKLLNKTYENKLQYNHNQLIYNIKQTLTQYFVVILLRFITINLYFHNLILILFHLFKTYFCTRIGFFLCN